jgi:hypothetical protein
VETSKGSLVVAYNKDDGVQGGICEITKEGHLISRFDSIFESINSVEENASKLFRLLAKAKFIGFNYLAIDTKDQVYVCDSENDELAVFDSRLVLLRVEKAGLNAMHRVQYLKEEMKLVLLYGPQKNQVFVMTLM